MKKASNDGGRLTKRAIIEDINSTGFASELTVVRVCRQADMQVEHSSVFRDKDTGKSREIDVVASMGKYDDDAKLRLSLTLVVEVKRTSKPWVVFMSSPPYENRAWGLLHHSRNVLEERELRSGGGKYLSGVLRGDVLGAPDERRPRKRVGKAFHEFKRKPGDDAPSQLYQGVLSAIKAAIHLKERSGRDEEETRFAKTSLVEVDLFVPVLVVDGIVFGAFADDKNGRTRVEASKYVAVEMKYTSEGYGTFWDPTFYPDLVTLKYFPTYLESMKEWFNSVGADFVDQLKRLRV